MGSVNATTIQAGTIVNTDIATSAGISASKLQHQQMAVANFELGDTGTPVVSDQTLLNASSAITIREVKAWLVDSGTTTDIDFDLEVDGASVLTGDINIVHGTGDQVSVSGTISSASVSSGSVITAVIKTVTSSTGATGPKMQIIYDAAYV
jgi:hypothetical protein